MMGEICSPVKSGYVKLTESIVDEACIIEIEGANAVWMDPVAVLNSAYCDYTVSPSQYYSRSYFDTRNTPTPFADTEHSSEKRKRKRKKTYSPNEKELLAEIRHQDSRAAILNAHSAFLSTTYPKISSRVNQIGTASTNVSTSTGKVNCELDFLQLAEVWQAPLYELNILERPSEITADEQGDCSDAGVKELVSNIHHLFNAVIEHKDEAIAECAGASFILPRHCRFLNSDVTELHQLIPDDSNFGHNLIVIDPPWENRSVHRKSLYPMIPNRQLLSLPVKQLAHTEGALVALWLTNREKLHQFVVKELFPAWEVNLAATWYWLKLNRSGEMISPLDLQHHKPYECLLLGYLSGESKEAVSNGSSKEAYCSRITAHGNSAPPDKFVVMSIPGDHSRKPPMCFLAQYAPGPTPMRGLELFARELSKGWTSWGNEPLHFQNLKYFLHKG